MFAAPTIMRRLVDVAKARGTAGVGLHSVIYAGGSNIHSRELEEVLLSRDAVHDVAVVEQGDAEGGEVVVAFVMCHAGADVVEAALDLLCRAQIARFKRPNASLFVEALPKNNYGKVLKTNLRARLIEATPT